MIKVTLSEESTSIKEWEHPCQTGLHKLNEAVKFVKLSVNDYLSELICQQKNFVPNDQMEMTEYFEVEEDDVSGFIKNVNIDKMPGQREKRKINYLNEAKKIRK